MSGDLFQSDSPAGDDFYRRIAPIYDPMVGPFLRPVRRAVSRIAAAGGRGRLLDIGCGTGEQAQMLANEGFIVTGIDLSPAMLAKARERTGRNPVGPGFQSAVEKGQPETSYIQGNAENLPFPPASFDCALISLALHEMNYSSAVRVTNEAIRVLAPGGKLIVFDYLRPLDFLAKLNLALLHIVERIAGKNHFKNFKYFVNRGGLDAFLEQFPLRTLSCRAFFGGAIGLAVSDRLT